MGWLSAARSDAVSGTSEKRKLLGTRRAYGCTLWKPPTSTEPRNAAFAAVDRLTHTFDFVDKSGGIDSSVLLRHRVEPLLGAMHE